MIDLSDAKNKTADGNLPSLDQIQDVFNRVTQNGLYKKKFSGLSLESWDDFFRLPMTTKDDLRECQAEDTLALPLSDVWHYHESFGTTGDPISTWFSKEDYEKEVDITWRWTEPIKPGMLVFNRFPYSFAVPPFILEVKCNRDGGVILPVGYLSWNVSYRRALEIMKRMRVAAIGCLPTEMLILEMVAEKCGYDIEKDFGSLEYVLASGRIIPNVLKEYIERRWKVSLSSVYGCTEGGGVASSCSAGNLHIHSDSFIIEILNPDDWKPVKEGEVGVLVLTSYYRKAAPLFRYITRDYCRVSTEPCSCGDPIPVIQVLGRMEDVIDIAGEKLLFLDVEQAILEFARQFDSAIYFIIITHKQLHIRIESHNGIQKPSLESLDELNEKLGVPLKVDICKKGELLDSGFLLRAPEIYKPQTISDWRSDPRRCVSLTEGLIKWPQVGAAEGADIARKSLKNALLRRTLK